ncbi:uncharacterized protein LOC127366560 isoform X2 [Dicentrarchus labrax]|uniref:uncharacterized protein LOC127366560 isoform X2 n=1 Tax=Dicentrarchus labrax TaxID=13489 RepID=UPI0021F5A7C6|nr:uncharacterized protein LOC127366560 isoform X2 [Dicentrarchus labrax]
MANFYLLGCFLLVLFMVISECRDSSPVIESVSAPQEEDVALPCFNSSVMKPESCNRVKLIKFATDSSQVKVILARPQTAKFPDAEHVKWQRDEKGQISLFLTKLQKSDEGQYSCEIWQGWDCIHFKNISLKVKECKVLQAVKAAPSTPINLTCPVDIKPQNISWVMLKGGSPVSVNSKRVKMNGTSLTIQSVNYGDGGWYRCKYMLEKSQRCFDINVLVQEENAVVATTVPDMSVPALTTIEILSTTTEKESSVALILVVVSVIIAIAIIAAPIGLLIYYRRNTQRNTLQIQRQPAGTRIESFDGYEVVNLTTSEANANQRVNSLYQQFQDESLCTCKLYYYHTLILIILK